MDKVKSFFAKQSVGFYLGVAATVLMLIGTIILATNCNMAYYRDYNAVIPLLGSLAVIIAIALLVITQFIKIPHIEALWVAVIVLMAAGLLVIVSMRIESIAIILGSDLEKDNPIAKPALNNFLAGAIITFIGLIVAVVASFFTVTKEN